MRTTISRGPSARGGGRPTAPGRRSWRRSAGGRRRGRSASPVTGSTNASGSSGAAHEEVHRHADADDRDADPPADLDHHRGQQDRQAPPVGDDEVEQRVPRVVVLPRRPREAELVVEVAARGRRTSAPGSRRPARRASASVPSSVCGPQHGGDGQRRPGRAARRRRSAASSSANRSSRANCSAPASIARPYRRIPSCRMYPGAYVDTHPDKPAIIMAATGDVTTFAELDAAANRVARLLRSAGVQPGDHVAFCMENHPRYFEVAWGCHYAGAVYTAASSRLTSGELSYILRDCEAKVFITSKYKADQADGDHRRHARRDAAPDARRHGRRLRVLRGRRRGPDAPSRSPTGSPAPTCSTRRARPGLPKGVAREFVAAAAGDGGHQRRRRAAAAVRDDRRVRLPVAGAAVPRRAAALLHEHERARGDRRRDGALRRRGSTSSSSSATGSPTPRSCRRCSCACSSCPRRSGPATTCRRCSASSTPPRRARCRSSSR